MEYKKLIDKMTLKEKVALLSGNGEFDTREIKRLEIPSICLSDGPNGVRKQVGASDHLGLNPSAPATCFPTAAAVANSWDLELGEKIGEGLGEEAMAAGVNVLLGPGLNIKRNPLCGRNFEYFSEDPYLSGKMAASYIRGIQKKGVYACAKHFAVNSQETRRMAMNSVVDERTLREIYLTGFEMAVKEGRVKAVMSSYNEVNGIYANENYHLLTDILRNEWGFDGIVVSDWGGSNNHVLGVRNGSTLEMPTTGFNSAKELLDAVNNGEIREEEIERRVNELLKAVYELTQSSEIYQKEKKDKLDIGTLHADNHALAKSAVEKSAVLLKNEAEILPLEKNTRVAVIGAFAYKPRFQGAGSSMVNAIQVDTIEECINNYELQIVGMSEGYLRTGEKDETLLREAVELAAKADVILYFFGLDEKHESEGLDRANLRISQNQSILLQELAKVNRNIVGVISAGGVIEMPWQCHCKALLHTYLMGEAGAGAVLDLLIGKKNPSGKLTETILNKYEDTPSYSYYPAQERNSEYREALFVGYRYFDTVGKQVLYPFGYGLSYTTFAYKSLNVQSDGVSFQLKNIGKYDGAEVVQLYVGLPKAKVFRPNKELKGFAKVFLRAGEEKTVKLPFDSYTFRYWNICTNSWETEGGEYQIMIGKNSRDICLSGTLHLRGTEASSPYVCAKLPSYYKGEVSAIKDSEFRELYGKEIPDGRWTGELEINDALCQMYYAKNPIARFVYRILHKRIERAERAGELPDLNMLFQYNMPFRAIAKMTGGIASMDMAKGIVSIVNGSFCKGVGQIFDGYLKKRKVKREFQEELKGGNT